MSRTAFCSAQPAAIFPARSSPIPDTSLSFSGVASIISKVPDPERVDNSLRQLGTDAANHSRAEIFLDALGGGRRGGFEKVGFELQPVGAIGRPNADGVYELSRRYRGGMPDDRDEVALAARLHLQDGEAIFLIVKSHPFDRADERFTRSGRVGCRPQDASWLPREFLG